MKKSAEAKTETSGSSKTASATHKRSHHVYLIQCSITPFAAVSSSNEIGVSTLRTAFEIIVFSPLLLANSNQLNCSPLLRESLIWMLHFSIKQFFAVGQLALTHWRPMNNDTKNERERRRKYLFVFSKQCAQIATMRIGSTTKWNWNR